MSRLKPNESYEGRRARRKKSRRRRHRTHDMMTLMGVGHARMALTPLMVERLAAKRAKAEAKA